MAPQKRKQAAKDDFIYTLSDDDEATRQEQLCSPPPQKKVKSRAGDKDQKLEAQKEDEDDGSWVQDDEDDGIDSDFQFDVDNSGIASDDDDGLQDWGFDGAKEGVQVPRKGADIDEIIKRRQERQNGSHVSASQDDEESVFDDAKLSMDDDDDQVLAQDAFGMNVEQHEAASDVADNDSVATPVAPREDYESAGSEGSDDDQGEDLEEQAKRDAFFAPEEMAPKTGKKTTREYSSFVEMHLSRPILLGIKAVGFEKPTPIQAKAIPVALMGKDLVGGAVTGSGKTGAFMIPILNRLFHRPNKVPTTRVVVLTPTRELAMQCHAVATRLASYTDIKFSLAVGGLSLKTQEAELRRRPDVVIATPGRFIDHMRNSASFNVDTVEILVLDEADRMLEDGFADELNEILNTLPKSRQTMLFSATMTSTVDRLIGVGMKKPVRLMVDAQKKTVGTLVQKFVRLRSGREEKRMGYLVYLCKRIYTERVIIFFRQKKDAHRARIVFGLLQLSCAELHGGLKQRQRIESIEAFRDGKVSFLLATDLASRGLDIRRIDTVINYEAPQSVEIYVHRVGRTARAGRRGTAVTLAAEGDRKVLKAAKKAGKAHGAQLVKLNVPASEADKWQGRIDEISEEVDEVMQEEQEENQLAQAAMQVKKGENLLRHEAEIKARPKRTWFETQHDKEKSRQVSRDSLNGRRENASRDSLNGMREKMKKKGGGKLSNKAKKKLDAKALRAEGPLWKGGKSKGQGAKGKGGVVKKRGSVGSKGQRGGTK
ncbi:hypothetical protein CP533_2368, partial [Ophiocordyceps camponoti-saundersi (nom. inval.)]